MSTNDLMLLSFIVIFSLVLICYFIYLYLDFFKDKNVKLLKEENEKLKELCAYSILKYVNLFSENEKLNKKLSKRK